jgi:acyl phosphate:glycerol-3-phosphate acyltransferase
VNDFIAFVIMAGIAFFSGSLMFAYWLGKLALRKDIRAVGDGNPGTVNVFRSGGKVVGVLAFALDMLKGAIPVFFAKWIFGFDGLELVIIAMMPVLGHAFSPWMNFNGGKAVAVTFGVWIGLTIYEIPMVSGLLIGVWFMLVTRSGWAIVLTLLSILVYILIVHGLDVVLLGFWAGSAALLAYKYRADLTAPPQLRPEIARRLWNRTP